MSTSIRSSFGSSNSGIASRLNSNRADGYSNSSANVVCNFQRAIETSATPNYVALRAALQWARNQKSFTADDLHSVYASHC